ncbi:MAG: HlyD family efflux transporter periplasmic adaptor subunit, partial [Chloroflexi bacterium]|nr:HlyD family efflux transporter periplasmic adaptor subunit [Chloroflexota bacterium]
VSAQREADLYFKNAGTLKALKVDAGQQVAEGQVLAELETGDLQTRIESAQIDYETAKTRHEQAKGADRAKKRELEIMAAKLAVQQAEMALARAEVDRAAALAGPTAVEKAAAAVRDAEHALANAQTNLVTVQKGDTVSRAVRDREYDHNWYEVRYGETKAKVERGQASQADLDQAWNALLTAKERLDSARAQAAKALADAENAVARAEDELKKVNATLTARRQAKEDPDRVAADLAVEGARLALERARADLAAKQQDTQDYELTLLANAAETARVNLDKLREQLKDSRLVAPFAGRVTYARGRSGEQVQGLQPFVGIADPSALIVRGELLETDLPKVAVGQPVSLTIDAFPGQTLAGTVMSVPTTFGSSTGGPVDRSARIRVNWPRTDVQLGYPARAAIVVQRKENVLIVPARAVKTVARRTFVEYLDGATRRSANVEVGIATESEVEIVKGLKEGQVVLAGQ